MAKPRAGTIALDGEAWFDASADRPPARRRRVGLVFQDYALFPHLSVRENVAFGATAAVDELLGGSGSPQLAAARPPELSGGERQRVALARALARDPECSCSTSHSSALDAHTKASAARARELLRELGLPTLLVTHDFEDAAALADRVGVIVEAGSSSSTRRRARRPAPDAFVASFTGANLLRGSRPPRGDGLTDPLESGEDLSPRTRPTGEVGVVVYPWEVSWRAQCPTPTPR